MREALLVMSGLPLAHDARDVQIGAELPPLELRTAYTYKGFGIGAGGLVGYLLWGPIGMVGLGFCGWYLGNRAAIAAEEKFTKEG